MSRRADLIAEAGKTIMSLYRKHGITSPDGVKQIIREKFSQEDLDAYTKALAQLEANGGI